MKKKPLSQEQMKEIKEKFAEKGILRVIDAQGLKSKKKSIDNNVMHEDEEYDVDDELQKNLSLSKKETDALLKQLICNKDDRNPKEIEVDWKNLKTI
jgi:folate-dependent tRNA-U54 methylase TrmFO/GidA